MPVGWVFFVFLAVKCVPTGYIVRPQLRLYIKIPASGRPEGAFTDMSKTTQTDTFKRLRAVMKDVNGDNRQIVRTLQDQVEYLLEKVAILEKIATEENDGKVPVYSEAQKKRLA